MTPEPPIRMHLILDPNGRYALWLEVNLIAQLATFNLEVETQGFVGFGLSKSGTMEGADIVAAEIGSNGDIHFNVILLSKFRTLNYKYLEKL